MDETRPTLDSPTAALTQLRGHRTALAGMHAHEREVRAMLRDPLNEGRYRGFGPLTSSATLEQALANCAMSAAIVSIDEPSIFLGIAQLGAVDLRHGTGQLMGCLTVEAQAKGWPAEGFIQFISRVFDSYPLRKLYCEVNGHNHASFGRGLGRFFQLEATLREHEWSNGGYVDVHFFSITRALFDTQWWGRGATTAAGASPLFDAVQQVVGVQLDNFDDSKSLEELGCDSLGLLEAVLILEERIGRTLPLEVVAELRTVGGLRHWANALEGQTPAQQP